MLKWVSIIPMKIYLIHVSTNHKELLQLNTTQAMDQRNIKTFFRNNIFAINKNSIDETEPIRLTM